MSMHESLNTSLAVLAALAFLWAGNAAAQEMDGHYGFGELASEELIKNWAIAIPPDGEHLPEGQGTPSQGKDVYEAQCTACHGDDLQGVADTGGAALIGGRGSLPQGEPPLKKTVESYWPYATTVFDYVRRAMPFTNPGSLSDEEVYAVTAYILYRADIISEDAVMNAQSLPKVEMPNRDGFINVYEQGKGRE